MFTKTFNLCPECANGMDCTEEKPHTECQDFELFDDDKEILLLYHGMTETMQTAIKEIMKVTQND